MAEGTNERKNESLSLRWGIAAIAGLFSILVVLMQWGIWAAAAMAFLVFLVLAYGKPYKRYRKFVYRGVFPAVFIILIVSYLLNWLLPDLIPDPITRLFFSVAMAVPCGIVPVLALIEIYGLARLHWVLALNPDLERKEALRFLRNLYFGLNYPVMVVTGNQAQTTLQGGPGGFLQKVGGPGLIFVNYGYAAVLECGGKYTRVVKGGAHFLKLYESPRAIVDLRRQQRNLRISNVYTRDGVPLDVELRIWYQIRRKKVPVPCAATPTERPSRGTQPPSLPSPSFPSNLPLWRRVLVDLASLVRSLAIGDKTRLLETILPQMSRLGAKLAGDKVPGADTVVGSPDLIDMAMRGAGGVEPQTPSCQKDYFAVADEDIADAVYNVDNWQASVETLADHVLRDVVAEKNLDALFDYDPDQRLFLPRKIIRQTVWGRMNRFLQKERWGVEVVLVDMGSVTIPESVSKRMLEKWLAEWDSRIALLQKQATILRGEAEAAALSTQETARAQASMQMINMLIQAIRGSGGLEMPDGFEHIIELRLIDALEKMAAEHVNGLVLPSDLLGILDSIAHRRSGPLSAASAPGDGSSDKPT